MTAPAVFLDRDGTLNVDVGYVYRADQWEWLPGTVEALGRLRARGFRTIVISNQSGVGRGYYSVEDVDRLHGWVNQGLAARGAGIDAFYYCPHLPDAGCPCRKPAPFMILTAAREHDIDLARSFMVGDKVIDVRAGRAAGVRAVLVRTGYGREEEKKLSPGEAAVADDLAAALPLVLG